MANFDDIIGQDAAKRYLQENIRNATLSHAYIINGEAGSGRRLLASALTKTLLCENRTPQGDACGKCKSCLQADAGSHPDIRFLPQDKEHIGVDDIREGLINNIDVKPYSAAHKVYVVPNADRMTVQAQNAILKTLEEPPSYAIILLLTENANALLDTVRSRCVTLNTEPLEQDVITQYLVKNLQMEEDQAKIAATFCRGNMGKAIRFASSDDVKQMKEDALQILKEIDRMDVSDILTMIRELSDRKGRIGEYLDLMLLWYRDVLMFKVTMDANLLLYRDEYSAIAKQASVRSYEDMEQIINAIEKTKVRLEANVNFETAMELLLLTIKEKSGR